MVQYREPYSISTTSDMHMIFHSNGKKERGTKDPLEGGE